MTTSELVPSKELLEKIAMVKNSLETAGNLVKQAYDLAIRDGFSPKQAREFLTAQLPFLAERTIRLALPSEAKDQSKVRTNFAARMPQKTINITSEHKVIDQPDEPEQTEIEKIGEIRRAEEKRKAEEPIKEDDEEDAKDIEIAFLKSQIEELKDALHKTEQFKPATSIPIKGDNITHPYPEGEDFFSIMRKQADGVHSFYYDAYGIDLFKNRELSQLKNSGVKTFKRLYFEV